MLTRVRPNGGSSAKRVASFSERVSIGVNRPLLFFLFFVSGFSSLVYQVVWTRLALASFGIITPVISVVLSVFLLGLSLGSWTGGRWVGRISRSVGLPPVSLYGLAELGIGIGAFTGATFVTFGRNRLRLL